MAEASLLDFLRSGELGPVRLGMTRDEVESVLGPPDTTGVTSRAFPRPQVWKYGDVELQWPGRTEELVTLYLDHFDTPTGGPSLALDPWVLHGGLTLAEAKDALVAEGVPFRELRSAAGRDQVVLIMECEAQLMFERREQEQTLRAVWRSRRASKPALAPRPHAPAACPLAVGVPSRQSPRRAACGG